MTEIINFANFLIDCLMVVSQYCTIIIDEIDAIAADVEYQYSQIEQLFNQSRQWFAFYQHYEVQLKAFYAYLQQLTFFLTTLTAQCLLLSLNLAQSVSGCIYDLVTFIYQCSEQLCQFIFRLMTDLLNN